MHHWHVQGRLTLLFPGPSGGSNTKSRQAFFIMRFLLRASHQIRRCASAGVRIGACAGIRSRCPSRAVVVVRRTPIYILSTAFESIFRHNQASGLARWLTADCSLHVLIVKKNKVSTTPHLDAYCQRFFTCFPATPAAHSTNKRRSSTESGGYVFFKDPPRLYRTTTTIREVKPDLYSTAWKNRTPFLKVHTINNNSTREILSLKIARYQVPGIR